MKRGLIFLAVVVLTGTLCGCAARTEPTASAPVTAPSHAAADVMLLERSGVSIAIPGKYSDMLLFDPEKNFYHTDGALLEVFHKPTYEEAAKHGATAGWLFSIVRYTRAQYERYLCKGDYSGQSFFAKDDTYYYGFFRPTDVQTTDKNDLKLFDEIKQKSGEFVRNDMISRNNLTSYSDDEFLNKTYTYDGNHVYLNYYPYYAYEGTKKAAQKLILSQPAKQGTEGIWCVERMYESGGTEPYIYFPDANGTPSEEYYAKLQAECDAGRSREMLDPVQAALSYVKTHYGHTAATADSFQSAAPPSTASAAPMPSAAVTQRPAPVIVTPAGLHYENAAMGFSLDFPDAWEGRYIIRESPSSVAVSSKAAGENGLLFRIERLTGELITQKRIDNLDRMGEILLRGNDCTYIASLRTELYSFDDEKLAAEYEALLDTRAEAYKSIKLLEGARPEAVNDGFKVVGTDFFTAEIPEKWDIKISSRAARWELYSGNTGVGGIRLIPYKSETPASDSETLREYVINDFRTSHSAEIALDAAHADSGTLQRIKDSVKMTGGASVVWVQSLANRYLELGGTKIFGKIESFDEKRSDINPQRVDFTAVNIRELNLIPDDSASGFHIEDTGRIVSYPLDAPQLAPLAAPDYRDYGTYDFFAISRATFYSDCPKYKDSYYDFIIVDGAVKVVLERHVPEK